MTMFSKMVFVVAVLGAIVAQGDDKDGASVQEQRFLKGITQLTNKDMGFEKAGEAYFSPNGKTIIFQAVPTGKEEYQIYTMSLETRKPKMVSTGKGACTCAFFHPNGKKIIFTSTHHGPLDQTSPDSGGGYKWDFNEHMDIFEANPDGSDLRQLTDTPGYDAEGSYSSDGKHIVFTSQRDGDLEIYVMDADGSNQHRITNARGYDGGPFFSPDGEFIVYRGDRRNDGKMNLQLRIVRTDGSYDRSITDNEIFNWCPFWYPTGKGFIFTQTDHEAWSRGSKPNYDLFMLTPESKYYTRITYDAEFDGLPSFSPDGKKLLWTSKRGGIEDSQIFIADFTLPEAFR